MDIQIGIFADLDLPIEGLHPLLPQQPLLQRLLNGLLIRQFLVRLSNGNELANAIVNLILLKLTGATIPVLASYLIPIMFAIHQGWVRWPVAFMFLGFQVVVRLWSEPEVQIALFLGLLVGVLLVVWRIWI